jgi:hypothetical protein
MKIFKTILDKYDWEDFLKIGILVVIFILPFGIWQILTIIARILIFVFSL